MKFNFLKKICVLKRLLTDLFKTIKKRIEFMNFEFKWHFVEQTMLNY